MNSLKRLMASPLCVTILTGVTACSGPDKTWAARANEKTLSVGIYIYYEYLAYQSASTKVEGFTRPALEQKIEDTDATQWIKRKALDYTKLLSVIDNKMKELKLSLIDTETKEIDSTATNQWSSYKGMPEGYDISKESFSMTTTEFNTKPSKVFEAIYGAKGSKTINDADLKTYFEKNYTDSSYVVIPPYNPTTYAALDEKTGKEYKQFLDDQAATLNKGSTTSDAVPTAVQKKLSLDYAPSQSMTTLLNEESDYPTDLISLANGMKAGEAKTITLPTASVAPLIVESDVMKKVATQISNANTRSKILGNMKHQGLKDEMAKLTEESRDITVNDRVIDSYQPITFVQKDTGSSSIAGRLI